nr:EOG090X0ECZ [Polyphemus pediculus]
MSSKFKPGDGDWNCPDSSCGNVNFARRDACNRCGKPKEEEKPKVKKLGVEIGKEAAEKSKGLFSADDWMCNKCGNVNWARRSTCNVCNAPKFGEVEERTGYGGGYNERGNVEYVEREESDDEFDEFGRIKKKFRKYPSNEKSFNSGASSSAPVVKDQYEDEEDEDEDDDEEGDLSKYDLGWGDESNDKSTDNKEDSPSKSESQATDTKPATKSNSSSHSRSRSSSRSRSRSR